MQLLGRQPTMKGHAYRYLKETAIPFRGEECLIWPFYKSQKGYGRLTRGGKTFMVHRLVCEASHGAPPSAIHQAAHSCGKGHLGCVSPKHLSWKTPAENNADKEVHGTVSRGERVPTSKLTEEDVLNIRRLSKATPQSEIASRYGVSRSTICTIVSRQAWGWLKPETLNSF